MKIKKFTLFLTLITLVTSGFSINVSADSITDLKEQEAQAQSKAEKIDNEINATLAEVNEKYTALADLEQKITKSEQTIKETETTILKTKETIEKRKETVAKRMQSMQLNGAQMNSFGAVLSAENFSDFLSRLYAVSVIQDAENSKVTALVSEQEKLEDLEETLANTQDDLKKQEQSIKVEQEALDQKVASLQTTYEENKELLTNLATKRAKAEATKKAEEEAAKKAAAEKLAKEQAAAKEAQEQQKVQTEESSVSSSQNHSSDNGHASTTKPEESTGHSNQSNDNSTTESTKPEESSKEPEITVPEPEKPSVSQGIAGQATAYLATGNLTATGTVPTPGRTIAVDPSVIPLGSLVQITVPSMPQYNGVYRAEDTGGAVKGNIIDIFFGNKADAINFGRRAIYFTVM